jgi:hypothetical protein
MKGSWEALVWVTDNWNCETWGSDLGMFWLIYVDKDVVNDDHDDDDYDDDDGIGSGNAKVEPRQLKNNIPFSSQF